MIRFATLNDAKEIVELNMKEWKNTYHGIFPKEFLDNLEKMKSDSIIKCQKKINEYIVFEDNGKIIGFLRFGVNKKGYSENYGEIYALYVLQEMQKSGIGRSLIDYVLENSKNKFDFFLVSTLTENSANAFYQKYGFNKIGNTDFEIDGNKYEENLYCINNN